MIKGFKDFILRGNILDLAVAFVIGVAFAVATGIGKTRTLQGLAEQLSSAGVPVPATVLDSRQGKSVERQVARGLCGLLKKSL